ncbi:MAG: hypothetical protein ACOQNY_03085 [Mycoplasmoidaceae bacterium]
MKNPYFKFIQIDPKIVESFINKHPSLETFIDKTKPFYVRVTKKIYAGLIHTIISQDETNANVLVIWNQLVDAVKKVSAKRVSKLTDEQLLKILGKKAELIKRITNDVINGNLDLKTLSKQPEALIYDTLRSYQGLNINTIQTFALFSCFKQDVLCEHDLDFIKGLKIFLNKQKIDEQDINHIKIEYRGQLTLFSLCMWRLNNERSGN